MLLDSGFSNLYRENVSSVIPLQSLVSDLINVLEMSHKKFNNLSRSMDNDVIDVIAFGSVGVWQFALNWSHRYFQIMAHVLLKFRVPNQLRVDDQPTSSLVLSRPNKTFWHRKKTFCSKLKSTYIFIYLFQFVFYVNFIFISDHGFIFTMDTSPLQILTFSSLKTPYPHVSTIVLSPRSTNTGLKLILWISRTWVSKPLYFG